MACRLLFYKIMVLYFISAFMVVFLSTEAFAQPMFSFDEKTHKLTLTNEHKNALCQRHLSDPTRVKRTDILMKVLSELVHKWRYPFAEIEETPNMNLYKSFQEFKLELMSTSPNKQKIRDARDRFVAAYKNEYQGRLSEHDLDENLYRYVNGIVFKYASIQSFEMGFSINITDVMGLFSTDYLEYFILLMNPEVLDVSVRSIMDQAVQDPGFEQEDIPDPIQELEKVLKWDESRDQLRLEAASEVLSQSYLALIMARTIHKNYPNVLSESNHKALARMENIFNQLLRWHDDTQGQICGKASYSAIDWCHTEDLAYKNKLTSLLNQINRDARYLKEPKSSGAVRGFVGINGALCKLDGSYHLLKVDKDQVTLTLALELETKNSSGGKKRTKINEIDLLEILGGSNNFQVLAPSK